MKNSINEIISKTINSSNIPKEMGNRIIQTTNNLYKKNEKKLEKKYYNKYYKMVAGLCASIILTTGIVFSKDINNYIKKIFNLNEHGIGAEQIESAISEDYLQYNQSEYIKSKDIAYKLEYSLLNDINMIFSIDFITDFKIDEFNDISISGLRIKDENGNQIYIDSEDEKIWTKNLATSMRLNKIEKVHDNEIKTSVVLVSPSFPNMDEVFISFDKIILYTIINGEVTTKEVDGNYNLNLKIQDKFKNRKISNYSVKNLTNDVNLSLEKVILTNTGLGITFNCTNFDCMGYDFEILDNNYNKLYSNKNDINCIGTSNRYFAWIDIKDEFRNISSFILKVNNLDGQVTTFILNKV